MFSDFVRQDIRHAYKLYNEGSITLENREKLIQDAKDKEYRESVLDISQIDPCLSTDEQLEEVKKLCYEKCAIGIIDVNEREKLIEEYTNLYKGNNQIKTNVYTEATAAQYKRRRNGLKIVTAFLAGIISMKKINRILQKHKIEKRFPEIKEINYQIKILEKQIQTQKKMLGGELDNIKQGYNDEFMQTDKIYDPVLSDDKKKNGVSNYRSVMSPKKILSRQEEEKRDNMENRMKQIVNLDSQLSENKKELIKMKDKLKKVVDKALKEKDLFNASEITALEKEMDVLSSNAAFSTTIL